MTSYNIKFYTSIPNVNNPRVHEVKRCESRNEDIVYCNTILDVKLVYDKYKMIDKNFVVDNIKPTNFNFLSYAIIPDVRYSDKVVCRLFQNKFKFETAFRFI